MLQYRINPWISVIIVLLCQITLGINAQNLSTAVPNILVSGAASSSSSGSSLSSSSAAQNDTSSVVDPNDPDNNDLFAATQQNMTCDGLYAFERTLNSAIQPSFTLAESNRSQTPIANTTEVAFTFPCNRRCQEADHCVAYVTDYNNARCLLLYQRPKQSREEFVPLTGLAYYEKVCLKIPKDMKCQKEWAFERVVGMTLDTVMDALIANLRTRAECMTACLTETAFVCRSARFNYQTHDCQLSRNSRRTMPLAFHSTTDQVDYLENQCAPEPQLCEYRAVEDRLFSAETEISHVENSVGCQSLCQNTQSFVCRAYRYDEANQQCLLSSDDRASIRATADQGQAQFLGYMERTECIDITMSCGPVSMTAVLKLNRPFNGRFYTADKPNQCVVVGNNEFEINLAMSLEGDECGSKSLGNGTFVNDVVVQMHPIVLRDSDRRVRVACDYPTNKITLTDELSVSGVPPRFMDPNQPNNASIVIGKATLPKVRLQIRNGSGKEVQGAQLGDALILSIDMEDAASAFGIAASDLVAMSGSGVETLQLLDGGGCPVEPSIFPSLSKVNDGHSLTSRFAAFKFASDSIVKFRVTVSFCLDSCPLPDCKSSLSSLGRKKRAVSSNDTLAVENRELTMELAILVDTEGNKAPTIGKDGVVNEALGAKLRNSVCTKSALIWGLGITAMIIQVITLSCCVASVTMYRQLKRQKGDIFESPSAATQTTLAWNSNAAAKNPDLFRMYK